MTQLDKNSFNISQIHVGRSFNVRFLYCSNFNLSYNWLKYIYWIIKCSVSKRQEALEREEAGVVQVEIQRGMWTWVFWKKNKYTKHAVGLQVGNEREGSAMDSFQFSAVELSIKVRQTVGETGLDMLTFRWLGLLKR